MNSTYKINVFRYNFLILYLGLLLQAHHKSHLHGNDTIHSPPDGTDAMFNTHSTPRHADDHEFIPKAADENYGKNIWKCSL